MRYFSETQRFNQWWLKFIMLSTHMVIIGVLFISYPTIEPHESDRFILVAAGTVIFMILLTMFVFSIKLITKIDEQGIHYQFYPMHHKDRIIRWEDMENCFVREYRPISEYGGWGYKVGLQKKSGALNIRGNSGIQVQMKSGRRLLIGTQKEKEARRVLMYYKDNQRLYA